MTLIRTLRSTLSRALPPLRSVLPGRGPRAVITQASGRLRPEAGAATLLVVVGPGFDQRIPKALVTARMGYCHAFEALGLPYRLVDIADLREAIDNVPRPLCFLTGYEYGLPAMSRATLRALARVPHFVWVNPWFRNSDRFFAEHGLDAQTWDWPDWHRRRILDSRPAFAFTATVPSGLNFFEQWDAHGVQTVSLPLACDTTLYTPQAPRRPEFEGVRLAFVGGYWESKGRQLDEYLRPFEHELAIYGYSAWPYRGYRGQLPRDAEPSLYRQALLCPTVNEPTVRLLRGQINERVFKILGAGGVTVVDAVPAYRELFTDSELIVPIDAAEFGWFVRKLLANEHLRREWARRGRDAVMRRHTYIHRVRSILKLLKLESLAPPDNAAESARAAA